MKVSNWLIRISLVGVAMRASEIHDSCGEILEGKVFLLWSIAPHKHRYFKK